MFVPFCHLNLNTSHESVPPTRGFATFQVAVVLFENASCNAHLTVGGPSRVPFEEDRDSSRSPR